MMARAQKFFDIKAVFDAKIIFRHPNTSVIVDYNVYAFLGS